MSHYCMFSVQGADRLVVVLIPALRRAVVREPVAVSNLRHCKDNESKSWTLGHTTPNICQEEFHAVVKQALHKCYEALENLLAKK